MTKIILLVICVINITPMFAQENNTLINFELKDQFDVEHKHSDYFGKVVILVGSDRGGSQYNHNWILPLIDSLKSHGVYDSTAFIGVADLRAVPFFLRFMVYGFMKEHNPEDPVLMDWDGDFAERYNFVKDHCNVVVFDKANKKVIQEAVKELDTTVFNNLLDSTIVHTRN